MLGSIILLPAATPCVSARTPVPPCTTRKRFLYFFSNAEPKVRRACYRGETICLELGHITCKHGRSLLFYGILLVMPSKVNPQALKQKQKWCPAVCTTPTRRHWVTVKPHSKVYLSSLKGSALTLGVSIDLGNTVPSAPEITKQNRRQIVNIISCYQGIDCQIIPRCNLTRRLTPFLSCTQPFCPQEKPDLDHLKLVALITTGICL